MSLTSKGSTELLVAGWQNVMFVVDLVKGEVVKRVGLCACPSKYLAPFN